MTTIHIFDFLRSMPQPPLKDGELFGISWDWDGGGFRGVLHCLIVGDAVLVDGALYTLNELVFASVGNRHADFMATVAEAFERMGAEYEC